MAKGHQLSLRLGWEKDKNLYDSGFKAFGHSAMALRQLLGAPRLSPTIIFQSLFPDEHSNFWVWL